MTSGRLLGFARRAKDSKAPPAALATPHTLVVATEDGRVAEIVLPHEEAELLTRLGLLFACAENEGHLHITPERLWTSVDVEALLVAVCP